MASVPIRHVLDLPPLPADARLRRVLSAALAGAGGPARSWQTLWPAEWFGLDHVHRFRAASAAEQQEVLRLASLGLVEEAWFIEKAGMVFAAKMSLLARTADERLLYSLFARDEATHFAELSAWLPPGHAPRPTPLHALLDEVIRDDPREVLVVVVQVVLEGWGLKHYRAMADATTDPALAALLGRIVADEALHHGSGALLLAEQPLAPEAVARATGRLEAVLAMVRAGPLAVLDALERVVGPVDRATTLQELDAHAHVAARLDVLRALLRSPNASPILDALEARGAFAPWEPAR